jgi:hypothetical protein
MSRSINIVATLLSNKIESKYGQGRAGINQFAVHMDVSEPTAYRWISESKLPLKKIVKLRRTLDFTKDEFKLLMPPAVKYNFSFRKKKGHDGLKKYHSLFTELAEAVEFVGNLDSMSDSIVLAQLDPTLGEEVVGKSIKSILSIPDSPMYSDIEKALKSKGINTFFFPFELLTEDLGEKKELKDVTAVAVKSMKTSKVFVIHNSNRTLKEASFDIIHELTHLFLRQGILEHDAEESFCNNVAKNFFLSKELINLTYKKDLNQLFNKEALDLLKCVSFINTICDDVNIDYMSAILRLTDEGFIRKGCEIDKLLWKNYYSNVLPFRKSVQEIESLSDVDSSFWFKEIVSEDKTRFNKLFRDFFQSYMIGNLSSRYITWLFSMNNIQLDKFKEKLPSAV